MSYAEYSLKYVKVSYMQRNTKFGKLVWHRYYSEHGRLAEAKRLLKRAETCGHAYGEVFSLETLEQWGSFGDPTAEEAWQDYRAERDKQ